MSDLEGAIRVLRDYQRQADEDGVEVTVNRQALDEVLAALAAAEARAEKATEEVVALRLAADPVARLYRSDIWESRARKAEEQARELNIECEFLIEISYQGGRKGHKYKELYEEAEARAAEWQARCGNATKSVDELSNKLYAAESDLACLKSFYESKSQGQCQHEVDKFSSRGCYNCVLLQAEKAESERDEARTLQASAEAIMRASGKLREEAWAKSERLAGALRDAIGVMANECVLTEAASNTLAECRAALQDAPAPVEWREKCEKLVAIFRNRIEKGRCERCAKGDVPHVGHDGNWSYWYHSVGNDGMLCDNSEWYSLLSVIHPDMRPAPAEKPEGEVKKLC